MQGRPLRAGFYAMLTPGSSGYQGLRPFERNEGDDGTVIVLLSARDLSLGTGVN